MWNAARLMPTIAAMFGPREDVTKYPVGQVLLALSLDHNTAMLDYWTGHHYGKIMEGKAKRR